MRFLLYPQRVLSKRTTRPLIREQAVSTTEPSRHLWGQQCGPTCGCVVRFEAVMNDDQYHLSYTAKRLLTRRQGAQLQAVLTAKGRPMFQTCACQTLHHLSSVLVHHYSHTASRRRLVSDLEFQSLRSSPAFGRTVLSSQGLPGSHTHCFDLVEEAWTALVKGYLPQPRRKLAIQPEELTPQTEFWEHSVEEQQDEEDDDLPSYQVQSQWSGALSSTLRMFDLNQQLQEAQELRMKTKKYGPLDWQAYVDQLYYEEQADDYEDDRTFA